MFKIYLAGYITGSVLDQCIAWRKKLREYYVMKDWNITWLDPLNGHYIESITDDGLACKIDGQNLIHRDYQSVIQSDLVVANLDTFGATRPLTGTICELAWAWEHHKPIIIISTDPYYTNHPFIKYFASSYVTSVEELIEKKLINYFFKGQNQAVY